MAAGQVRAGGWKQFVFSFLVCAAILGGGTGAFVGLAALKTSPPTVERPARQFKVQVFAVEPATLEETLVGYGTAVALREVTVSAEVAGRVVAIDPNLKRGGVVRAPHVAQDDAGASQRIPGDPLVSIDPQSYEHRLSLAERRLDEDEAELRVLEKQQRNTEKLLELAQKDLEHYQAEFDRVVDLVRKQIKTEEDATRARLELTRYAAAAAQYENELALYSERRSLIERRKLTHQADVDLARLEKERTTVAAPFSGRVSQVDVEMGQYVRPGEPLFKLHDLSQIEVAISLSLADYLKIAERLASHEPLPVELAPNESAEASWRGEVVRSSPVADATTRTVRVYALVRNDEQPTPLLPGSFVQARIRGPRLESVLAVPRDAVVRGRAFVAKSGRAVEVAVQVERTLQSLAIVAKGLSAGDRLILTNLDQLFTDALVEEHGVLTLDDELQHQAIPLARRIER